MNSERIKKLERVARDLVTRFIFEELEDSEKTFGIITVTDIKISPDLSYLDIFVSSFHNGDILPKTLASHNHDIQHRLNKAINIRKLPRIRFRYDNSGAISTDVLNTLNTLSK